MTPAAEEARRGGELSLSSDPRTRQALNMFGLETKQYPLLNDVKIACGGSST